MNRQTYFVMRKNLTGVQRRIWISPITGNAFCGVCLRGRVDSQVGSQCAVCESKVVREFTAIPGGASRSPLAAVRAERRARNAQRGVRAARSGNVLIMQAG
jgi:hypothetical protein